MSKNSTKTWKSRKWELQTRVPVLRTRVPNFGHIYRHAIETPEGGRLGLIFFSKFSLPGGNTELETPAFGRLYVTPPPEICSSSSNSERSHSNFSVHLRDFASWRRYAARRNNTVVTVVRQLPVTHGADVTNCQNFLEKRRAL